MFHPPTKRGNALIARKTIAGKRARQQSQQFPPLRLSLSLSLSPTPIKKTWAHPTCTQERTKLTSHLTDRSFSMPNPSPNLFRTQLVREFQTLCNREEATRTRNPVRQATNTKSSPLSLGTCSPGSPCDSSFFLSKFRRSFDKQPRNFDLLPRDLAPGGTPDNTVTSRLCVFD